MIQQILQNAGSVLGAAPELSRLHNATNDFETAFVKQLVTELRKSDSNEFGDVPGSGIYDEMANQVLAEKMSAKGGFGISQTMFNQLSKLVLAESAQSQTVKKP